MASMSGSANSGAASCVGSFKMGEVGRMDDGVREPARENA